MFTGLSAFPLTPLREDAVDEGAFIRIIERLAASDVDSITALGSTGSYAYLNADERRSVTSLAVEHAGAKPVFAGVGALRTSHVLQNIDNAEKAGASAVLLAPVSYQPLTQDDVFQLFRTVSAHTSLPVIVYDNPGTTHFSFTLELYASIAELPGTASIKIPPLPADANAAREHVAAIRAAIPGHVSLGISGDGSAARGLAAGCDGWYSVLAGLLPEPALTITRAAQEGRLDDALAESERLNALWDLYAEFGGSQRVIAAIAEHLDMAPPRCLPLPIQGLDDPQRARVAEVLRDLNLI